MTDSKPSWAHGAVGNVIAFPSTKPSGADKTPVELVDAWIAAKQKSEATGYGFPHEVGEICRYENHPMFGNLAVRVTKLDSQGVVVAAELVQ